MKLGRKEVKTETAMSALSVFILERAAWWVKIHRNATEMDVKEQLQLCSLFVCCDFQQSGGKAVTTERNEKKLQTVIYARIKPAVIVNTL